MEAPNPRPGACRTCAPVWSASNAGPTGSWTLPGKAGLLWSQTGYPLYSSEVAPQTDGLSRPSFSSSSSSSSSIVTTQIFRPPPQNLWASTTSAWCLTEQSRRSRATKRRRQSVGRKEKMGRFACTSRCKSTGTGLGPTDSYSYTRIPLTDSLTRFLLLLRGGSRSSVVAAVSAASAREENSLRR